MACVCHLYCNRKYINEQIIIRYMGLNIEKIYDFKIEFKYVQFPIRLWILRRGICDRRHLMSAEHEFSTAARSN